MPILQRSIGVGSHEGMPQVVLVGVEGQPGDRRVIGPFQDILHVFCMKGCLLWLEETIFMSPLEHPAAK